MYFKYRMCVLKVIFACLCLVGQQAYAESLGNIVEKALHHNPAIKSANAAHEAALYEKKSEIAGYFPDISTSATGGRVYQDNATSRGLVTTRGAAYSGYGEANIAVRQKIFDGFETQSRVDAADARTRSREFLLRETQNNIIANLARAYIDVLRISYALSHFDRQLENIKDYQARIKKMVEQGAADETELKQALDVSMIIRKLRADYEGQLQTAISYFREVSGQDVPKTVEIPKTLGAYISKNKDEAIAKAIENHPAIKSAILDAKAAEHDIQAQIGQNYYPDLGAELSYLKSDKRDEIGGEATDARAVMRMNWNFSLGWRGHALIRQKRAEHRESLARYEEIERQITREIEQAYANYETLGRKFALSQDRVKLNKDLLSAYKIQFEGARIGLLNLMRAESQTFNAILEENDNYFNLLAAEYNLLSKTENLKNLILKAEKTDE